MKRFFTFFLVLMLSFLLIQKNTFAETNLRNYKSIQLAKGSFLKAISQREISTSNVKAGDVEYFINPADVFVGTSNVIPKDSVYLGVVEEVMEAVEGINASMKIKIYKVITPDRNEFSIDANVFWKGSTTIGGDLSEVAYYVRMPHYPGDWKKGALQLVPTSIREHGKPTVIRAGEEVTFIINNEHSLYKPIK
ncbi:MAG: hypothetical protein KHX03_09385 [Clostridium sp.]|nr:hypothetical protein [Clostridium sp.]